MALESTGAIALYPGTTATWAGGGLVSYESTQIPGMYVVSTGLTGGLKNHVVAKSRQTGLKIESSLNRTWQTQAAPINGIIQPVYTSSVRVVLETNDPSSTPAVVYNQFLALTRYIDLTKLTKLMSGQV